MGFFSGFYRKGNIMTIWCEILKKSIFLLVLAALGLMGGASAIHAASTKTAIGVNAPAIPLGYWESLPAAYAANPTQNFPVVIFFHGLGEGGNGTVGTELNRLLVNGPMQFINNPGEPLRDIFDQNNTIVIAAQIPAGNWWYASSVRQVVNYVTSHYRVDPTRIYLTGLSAGCSGLMDFLNFDANPTQAAAVMVCAYRGGLNANGAQTIHSVPFWVLTAYGDLAPQAGDAVNWMAEALMGAGVPNCFTNYPGGSAPAAVYTGNFSATTGAWTWTSPGGSSGVDSLSGVKPKITIFTGSDHNSWDRTYKNAATWNWLFAQHKGGESIPPSITITTPTSAATYAASTATINLTGIASDNIGVTQVTWVNDRGGNGTAAGTTSWAANSMTLQSGVNVITVTARDAANNSATDVLTVTYTAGDTTAPTVAIGSPTSASTYATASAAISLSGTASDNVGVTQVTWSNDRGGSGTATGTTSWVANTIALQSGVNVVTVTACDAANNPATDILTITYTPPSGSGSWTGTDIGTVGVAGSYSVAGGTVTLSGSGTTMAGNTNQHYYAYQATTGDCSIIARVQSMQNTATGARAGLMIRETTAENAAFACVGLSPSWGSNSLGHPANQSWYDAQAGGTGTAPYWLKLGRTGNSFTASISSNGTSWTVIGTYTVPMGNSATMGLMVFSNTATLNTAVFDNITMTGLTPPTWTGANIGTIGTAGSFSQAGGTITVNGSGATMAGNTNQHYYAYQAATGDCTIVARVQSMQNTSTSAKAGVMIRETTAENAAFAYVGLYPSWGSNSLGHPQNQSWYDAQSGGSGSAPYWVKLVRTGNIFTGSTSPNGTTWTVIGTYTVPMGSSAQIGLMVHSNTSGLNTAVFDNVTVIP
jgi:poly(3-hydroxybutyrate) depolymerase